MVLENDNLEVVKSLRISETLFLSLFSIDSNNSLILKEAYNLAPILYCTEEIIIAFPSIPILYSTKEIFDVLLSSIKTSLIKIKLLFNIPSFGGVPLRAR